MLTVSTKDLMAAAPGPRGPGRPAAGWWTTGTVLPVAAVQAEWRCLNWVCRGTTCSPADAYRRAFDALLEALGGRKALPPDGGSARPGP